MLPNNNVSQVQSGAEVRRVADLLRQHGAKDRDIWYEKTQYVAVAALACEDA